MATPIRNTHFLLALIAPWIDALKRAIHTAGVAGAVTGSSAAGSSHNHAFTGTAPSKSEEEVFTGTGFATAGQVVTSTESLTLGLNEYAGCWLLPATQPPVLIVSHPAVAAAPAAFTVYGLAPTTDAGGYKILRAPTPAGTNAAESTHTHGAGTYSAGAGTVAVHYDRAEYAVTAANATDAPTLLTLTLAVMVSYITHVRDLLAHDAADTTNDPDSTVSIQELISPIVGTATCITYLNNLKASLNAHRSQSGVHPTNDSGHAVTSPDATDLASAITLANEIKGDLNAHMADGQLPASWRVGGY